MQVSLLADHNLQRLAVSLFRDRGHDIVSSRELGLDRATDGHLLLFAAVEQRTLLTSNSDDFVLLHDAWHRWSAAWGSEAQHAGIIVFPQGQLWDAARVVDEVERVIGPAGAEHPTRYFANRLWRWLPLGGWGISHP